MKMIFYIFVFVLTACNISISNDNVFLSVDVENFTVTSGPEKTIIEAETFKLFNAEVQDLEGASNNKAIYLSNKSSRAELDIDLKKGSYYVTAYACAGSSDRDSFAVEISGGSEKLSPDNLNKISSCKTFIISLPKSKKYKFKIKSVDAGMYIDRIEIISSIITRDKQTVNNNKKEMKILDVKQEFNASAIPCYDIFEITFTHDKKYESPFFDVEVAARFISPAGKEFNIGGFHYGSLEKPEIIQKGKKEYIFKKQNIWKARFSPNEIGLWRYFYFFANKNGEWTEGHGSFECIKGKKPLSGFIRQNSSNPFRWVTDDGQPYYPVGIQTCLNDGFGVGSVLSAMSMEGPFRQDKSNLKIMDKLPEDPIYKRGPSNNPQNGDVFFRHFSKSGFNLFRFSQDNCSFAQYSDLTHYNVQECNMTDELLKFSRKYGFHIFYGIFGYQKVYNDTPDCKEEMALVKHFIRYSVNRWGAYVDIWQFLNEQNAVDGWYAEMVPYLKSICPYKHLITTSWQRPELNGIEINAPHWYVNVSISELKSDLVAAKEVGKQKKEFKKPVIYGETGNIIETENNKLYGFGGVWDPLSALRMRIRSWAFFFNEASFVFWETSYAKDGHYMNIWLGPKEREYIRALQDFSNRLDKGIRINNVVVSNPEKVRAYGLKSEKTAAIYLHHFSNHTEFEKGLKITFEAPVNAKGYWYNPENAAILGIFETKPGEQTVTAPDFKIDLALLVTPDGPPDIDNDGIQNDKDSDNDGDGVENTKDAFPLESEERDDADSDMIGDNMDADVNADGIGDDKNKNGIPDNEETDIDKDGVLTSKSVPWDAFPLDPKEWADTDGDGIGDNADLDDDNDGYTDEEEMQVGTNPLDRLNFPK